jgi:hypothetical protein
MGEKYPGDESISELPDPAEPLRKIKSDTWRRSPRILWRRSSTSEKALTDATTIPLSKASSRRKKSGRAKWFGLWRAAVMVVPATIATRI